MSAAAAPRRSRSLWSDAFSRLTAEKLVLLCMGIILLYGFVALAAKVGLIASTWNQEVGAPYSPPDFSSIKTCLGTDIFGRSVFYKVIHGTRIAMSVGLVAALISIPIGVVLGAVTGYFGGWVDEVIVWFYTTISSIPSILLLTAVTFILGKGLFSVSLALGATSWVSLARLVRGEFMKHKIGSTWWRKPWGPVTRRESSVTSCPIRFTSPWLIFHCSFKSRLKLKLFYLIWDWVPWAAQLGYHDR